MGWEFLKQLPITSIFPYVYGAYTTNYGAKPTNNNNMTETIRLIEPEFAEFKEAAKKFTDNQLHTCVTDRETMIAHVGKVVNDMICKRKQIPSEVAGRSVEIYDTLRTLALEEVHRRWSQLTVNNN